MIHEFFLYLKEKVDPRAIKFGHLKESIALIKRYERCFPYWQSHIEECHQIILSAITDLKNQKKKCERILILGSGPLHEIPIEFLANNFKEVVLVDIVHLKQIRKKYQYLKNIIFVEHDISELENILLQEKKLINISPTRFLEEHFDLVVSANLLSQMPYHLKKFILKKIPNITENELDNFCFQVSLDHFNYLQKFNCPVVLYTDIETHLFNPQKNTLEIESPYINFTLPKCTKEWMWNLAPTPEINPEISLQMKVVGIILNT